MDRDKDAKLTFDEFVEGSKQDPTIVQVRTVHRSSQHFHPLTMVFLGLILIRWSCVAPWRVVDDSVACSLRLLVIHYSVACPGGIGRFLPLVMM